MPKNSNIFKSWFKAKQKKSNDENSIKQSPLISRLSNNENQSSASPKRKTSLFGIQFNLSSSNNSSKLSIISTGNNKYNGDDSSHQNDNQSQKSISSLIDSKNSNVEDFTKKKKKKLLINSSTHKSSNNTSMNILQQLAQRFNPGKNSRSINSSPKNISSGNLTTPIPKSPKNLNNQNKIDEENAFIKQATFSLVKNEQNNSAFSRINSSIDTKHLFNSNKNTSQQQKQLQFQQQRFLNKSTHISNQSFNQQKPSFNEQEIVTVHSKNVSVISSSGLITTINESFVESIQDSSDAEIVEVFSKNEKQDSLELLKEIDFNEKGSLDKMNCINTKFSSNIEHENYLQDKNNNLNLFKNDIKKNMKEYDTIKKNDENIENSFDETFKKNLDKIEMSLIIQDSKLNKLDSQDVNKNNQAFLETATDLDNLSELNYNGEDYAFYDNKKGLGEDLKFLAFMPELCDITFLVGETREPVCAVGAVLGSRSKVFYKLLYGQKAYSNQQYYNENDSQNEKSTLTKSTRRSIFGRKESIFDNEINSVNDSKRSREDSNRRSLLRYSKSKKLKENKEAKLKLFLKRGSEPMLNGLPLNQQIQPLVHQTMIIEEFEPDVFRQLIEYIHTGIVVLQARTLLGLMNAADYYGLEELRKACMGFVSACISVDTVCALLAGAERYIQYKCTKSLVQRVLEFVDNHGNEVLSLGSFTLLPEHVVRLILSREELKAEELIKFQAVLQWSQRYCDGSPGAVDLREVVKGFFECIEFYKIPATVLMREVHPLNIVPDHIIMNALAYQADPKSIDICKVESPNRFRRMTLPHALNISGSDLLNLHRQSLVPFKSERSASTSTSGYNTECSMFSTNNTSSGNLVSKKSFKRKKGEQQEDDNLEDQDKKNQKSKNKEKDKQNKVGKRRGSRPFRRAMTLFEGK